MHYKSFTSLSVSQLLGLATLAAALFLSLGTTSVVEAHSDPVGCTGVGVGLSISVFRDNGVDPVATSGDGTVQSGETIKYQATLNHLGGTNCNFESGDLTIVTPDGTPHLVASGGDIGLVTFGVPYISSQVSYVVSEADVNAGDLDASADYENGTAHFGVNEQTVGADANISTPYTDLELIVEKTAVPAAEEGFRWTIDKSVTPATWDLFVGDSGTSEYTIMLDKISTGVSYSVSGTITINNPALFADAEGVAVSDTISGIGAVDVDCGVALPTTIPAGGQLVCSYSHDLGGDDTARTNTADVTTTGDVGGGSADADFDPTTANPVDNSTPVNVDDTFDEGDSANHGGPFSDDVTYTYTRTFTCDDGQNEYEGQGNEVDNIAEIVETGASDDALVTVSCYDLEVEKTADGTYDLAWEWGIEKTAGDINLLLQEGEIYLVDYEVTVDIVGSSEINHMIEGEIAIINNHPTLDAELVDVTDSLGPVDCGGVTSVPADDFIVCTYGPVDSDADENTATAEQQNYDYDETGAPTAGGTTEYENTVGVDYSLNDEIDECIDVNDTNVGFLGTVCADAAPETFNYQLEFSTDPDETNDITDVVLECGEIEWPNVADFVTNDTAATGTAEWVVTPNVECVIGCTLTQGYWKTHSAYGPAPYDQEGWSVIPDEADEIFFLSGMSWHDVFWTPPAGNKYYNLAHQYMAAKLNILNDASAPAEVEDAIADAEAFFEAHDTELFSYAKQNKNGKDVGKKTLLIDEDLYASLTTLAGVLGAFNEGDIGPGHCDEDETSDNSF